MTDLQEKAMRMALEALKKSHPISNSNEDLYAHSEAGSELYNELKKAKALAQPEQEPVAPPDVSNVVLAAVLAEREACAKVCEDNAKEWIDGNNDWCQGQAVGSNDCAAAIRARGEK